MMEFTLVYRNALPSTTQKKTRMAEKHTIQLDLSPQLAELWRIDPKLSGYMDRASEFPRARESTWEKRRLTPTKRPADPVPLPSPYQYFEMAGSRFLPLMTRQNGLFCHLNIKFLRRGEPGNLVGQDGDLDNRLKTLFDGLRAPQIPEEIDTRVALPRDVYCLLEDDCLITGFSVEAQPLLEPETTNRPQSYVELHIAVRVQATR